MSVSISFKVAYETIVARAPGIGVEYIASTAPNGSAIVAKRVSETVVEASAGGRKFSLMAGDSLILTLSQTAQ